MCAIAGEGLRGTDQYWYAADLKVAEQLDAAVTNTVYPIASLGEPSLHPGELPPRIHNVPATYLADVAYELVEHEYYSWLYLNVLLGLLTSLLIWRSAVMLRMPCATLAPSLFLLFPMTLWLTVNALSEMFIALLVATVALSLTLVMSRRHPATGLVVGMSAVSLLAWSRASFLLLAPIALTFALYAGRRGFVSRRVMYIAVFSMLASIFFITWAIPAYPSPSLSSILMVLTSAAPESMGHYYRPDGIPFAVGPFMRKATKGLLQALVPTSSAELLTSFPLTLGMFVGAAVTWQHRSRRWLSIFATFVLLIHLATSMAFQSQARYAFAFAPLVALLLGAATAELGRRAPHMPRSLTIASLLTVAGLFATTSAVVAYQYRSSATVEASLRDELADTLSPAAMGGATMVVGNNQQVLSVAYILAPFPVLPVDPSVNDAADIEALQSEWDVLTLVIPVDAEGSARSIVEGDATGSQWLKVAGSRSPGGPVEVWRRAR